MRLMVFDATCSTTPLGPLGALPVGLTHAWTAGGPLYHRLGRIDAFHGAHTWDDALSWLATVEPAQPIAEVQFWGHGNRGMARIDGQPLNGGSLAARHPHRRRLEQIRARMSPSSRWWFRTCDTFGGVAGHDFARRWTDFFGCDAAGFTYVIGIWQSGLHRLAPGTEPHWDVTEGIAEGTAHAPRRSANSAPWRPNTVHFLSGEIPAGW
jgi:hypothetical protein